MWSWFRTEPGGFKEFLQLVSGGICSSSTIFWGHSCWTWFFSNRIPTKLGAVLLKGVLWTEEMCWAKESSSVWGKRFQQPEKAQAQLRCGAARTGWALWRVPGELEQPNRLSQVIMALWKGHHLEIARTAAQVVKRWHHNNPKLLGCSFPTLVSVMGLYHCAILLFFFLYHEFLL